MCHRFDVHDGIVRERLRDALRGSNKDAQEEAELRLELARAELACGEPAAALEEIDAVLELAGRDTSSPIAISALARRAQVLAWLGRLEEASRDADSAARHPAASARARSWAARARGRAAAAQGDVEVALAHFDTALGELRSVGDAGAVMAAISLDAAEALLDRDGPVDSSAAAGRLAEARDHVDAGAVERLRPRLTILLARARGANGDPDGAVSELEASALEDVEIPRDIGWLAHSARALLYEQRGSEFLARRSWEQAVEALEGIALSLGRDLRESFWSDARRQRARRRAAGGGASRRAAQERTAAPLRDGRVARLMEILKRLVSETDLDRLLERITDHAIELSGAERGFVLLSGEDGSALTPHTVRGVANPGDPHAAFSRSIAEAVLIDGEPLMTVDARTDHRLSEYISVHKLLLKSVACVPIRGRKGTVGVLYLEHRMRRGRFSEDDLELLLAFADQAAIALENARLLASLARRSEELERSNEELAQAKEKIERLLDAKTVELAEARTELDRARDALRIANDRHGIVGHSAPMRRVFAVVDRVRDTDVPIVIQGESGTGKELIARAIHFGSARAKKSFVPLNCAAIPEALLESELFGHVRGAFTGADRDRTGVIVKASGGTLFLDEVGDMPAKMQVDLLRVLQDGRVRPVGGEVEIEVDVRVIAASNKSLQDLVSAGSFRKDLYYRLNVVELWLPALRERMEDVPLLCDHFLALFAERDESAPKRISRRAVQRIVTHPLPGNVRQLEHLLLNAWVMAEGDVIDAEDLALAEDGTSVAVPPRIDRALATDEADHAAVREAPPPSSVEEYKEQERRRILEALETHNWNRVRAAKALGIARRTFYRRLKEYQIL